MWVFPEYSKVVPKSFHYITNTYIKLWTYSIKKNVDLQIVF